MGISTIRSYEPGDQARVQAAAERFCNRHGIKFDNTDPVFGAAAAENEIDYWLHNSHPQDAAYRRKLWTGVYCRALRVSYDVRTTTGWGYIGVRVD